jgi:hypothetical protein
LRKAERGLLDQVVGVADAYVVSRTGARTDTGKWFRNARVSASATAADLILFAAGRVPFVQKTPLDRLRESVFNPVTGELVLAPGDGNLRISRVRMATLDGYQLLAQIAGGAVR